MTTREKAICELFTGICFCTGERRKHVYEYAAELMGRPVLTHEFAELADELRAPAPTSWPSAEPNPPPRPHSPNL